MKEKTLYNKRIWLNDETTPSTGSVVAYHGISDNFFKENEKNENLFIEIADCHSKARLHKTIYETREQFINKLRLLNSEIENFIKYLEKC